MQTGKESPSFLKISMMIKKKKSTLIISVEICKHRSWEQSCLGNAISCWHMFYRYFLDLQTSWLYLCVCWEQICCLSRLVQKWFLITLSKIRLCIKIWNSWREKKSCSCSSVFMEPPAPHWLNPTSFSFLLLKGKMNVWGIGWCYQHNKGIFKLVFSLTEGDQQSFWVSFSWAKTRKKWPYFLYQTAGLLQRRREPRQGDNPCWFYRKCLFKKKWQTHF